MLYVVHGLQHLLGYDDHDPGDRARMRRAEARLLEAIGLPHVYGARVPGKVPSKEEAR
jgi:ssRNA-specific RNase YbeY (16S rRNA maturation enzyme)